MAEQQTSLVEFDPAFLQTKRGLLKISEMVVTFVAFICFAVSAGSPYIAAMCLELIFTLALLLMYLLKLHKSFTFFFWPLVDVFNSLFAAAFVLVISLVAVSTYTEETTLAGGIVGLVAAALWCADGFYIFKKISFNLPAAAPAY